ncbi:amino-acid ABC transporter binding protein [Bartonella clarridgeiae 73]|uniref:Amino-acid ABC transporter binding protein n=1 Tax=Bartonella clarridgeiae (strain CCUG 45776 / CIP 104772 / 73) TaxID=696125 RepID=E6YID7_BARC7|nr:transporter substrate-binding domain-containing protein [Bartonella clarridgeiae]WCR54806.1 MAG: Glutamate/aspartate ABC transporter substrate-binding protein GltI [Bartonella clarridgeiae]CBI76625.1 amino-acid ABC transporter binding protein [Bartonella clarridgeiae 73]
MRKSLLIFIVVISMGLTSIAHATNDTLEKIKKTGEITLGVRESSGLAYALGNGKYTGFHTEMAERIIDDISKKIGKPIKVNYLPITSQNRIPLLKNGTYDFECGSTTNDSARSKEAAFAYTTYVESVKIVVKKNSGIKSIDDLNGKTVATTTGTTAVQLIRKNKRQKNIHFKVVNGKDHGDSFLLLESGRADAFVMDTSILSANIAKSKNPSDYIILDTTLSVEPIACMLRLNDKNFEQVINDSIVRQINDSSLEKLYNKWFMEPIPPTNTIINLPLSKETQYAWEHPNNKPRENYIENKL